MLKTLKKSSSVDNEAQDKVAKHYCPSLNGQSDTEWRIGTLKIIKSINQVKLGFRATIF